MSESINAEREALRAGLDNPEPSPQPSATPSSPTPSPESKPTEEVKPESNQDDGTKPAPKPEDNPEGKDGEAKKESNYEKAKRGRERLEDIRQKAEAEKAAARAEREAAEKLRQEMRQELAQIRQSQGRNGDLTDGGRFSAEEFERASDWYESEAEKAVMEGDLEKYEELIKNARSTRTAAKTIRTQQQQAAQQQALGQFAQAYRTNAEKVIEANPQLGDPNSEDAKAMVELLQSEPILTMTPDGFKKAWEILQMRQTSGDIVSLSPEQKKEYNEAGKAAGLLKQLKELKAEVQRLTNLTSPEKGSLSPISNTDNFDSMPVEKQREVLRARAEGGL